MAHVIPNINWYTLISKNKCLAPRCPFASVHRCPRFYQSLFLLGSAGSTSIDCKENKKLLRRWRKSDLWPVTREQETTIYGTRGEYKDFCNFCPEVTFERFGFFASDLARYAGEDVGVAHPNLSKESASSNDWRWSWAHVAPMHYSECPLFSSLLNPSYGQDGPKSIKKVLTGDVLELKPNFYGIGINLNTLIKRFLQWFSKR